MSIPNNDISVSLQAKSMTDDVTVNYEWIDNDQALISLCKKLSSKSAIAVDTEFVRTNTYYPHLGLLQLADDEGVYLIDPLSISNTQPISDLLINPAVVKVVHSCSEDLETFLHAYGVLPVSLFDTQIAAGFAGYGMSIGYANLLKELKNITIPKQETRSNWLQRPLSDAQLRYAALDVVYLLDIYHILVAQLQKDNRLFWVESDCDAIVDKLRNTDNEAHYYLRIKSAWKLRPDQLAVLKTVSAWREQQARENDVPRGRIIKDPVLFDLATKLPSDMQQLKRVENISYRFIDEYGKSILCLVNQTLDNEVDYPEQLEQPLTKEQTRVLKLLKQRVANIADKLAIPQSLLVRKKDYDTLIRSYCDTGRCQLPPSLLGWRQSVVGDDLQTYAGHLLSGKSL